MSGESGEKIRRLFWDLETSENIGTFWRSGYKIRVPETNIIRERAIICACWKWEGEKRVHALEWDKGCDKKLLEKFLPVMLEADECVAHNGDRFDVKWINGRLLHNGMEPLPYDLKTTDTLKQARRRFYLNSNRLDYLSKILGRQGKKKTQYEWWRDILLHDCPKAMAKMVRYCKADVIELQWVYNKLHIFDAPATHAGVFAGLDKWSCPYCASELVYYKNKRVTTKGTIQRRMRCHACERTYQISNRSWLDYGAHKIEQRKKNDLPPDGRLFTSKAKAKKSE